IRRSRLAVGVSQRRRQPASLPMGSDRPSSRGDCGDRWARHAMAAPGAPMMRRRRGVAMATVLAVLALASVLAFATAEAGHLSLAGARNRAHEAAAYWLAQGCLARTVAELDSRWTVLDDLSRARFWRELDLETARSVRVPRDCRLTLRS